MIAFYQVTLRFGICVPSACSENDLQQFGTEVAKPLNYGIQISKCHIAEEPKLEPLHIIILIVVFLLLLMMFSGTIIDIYVRRKTDLSKKTTFTKTKLHEEILVAFSVSANCNRLWSSQSKAEQMQCLHGIRAISMTWVILGHTYVWINYQALRKSSIASDWFNNIEFEAILNGWLSVTSFVFLSGLLTSHTTIRYMQTTNGKINIFLYIFRRFVRLYPSVLLVLGVMFFLPWVATGPFWMELPGVEVANCRQYFWTNLLFINNWMPVREMCMQHSWYISADMQLHIGALFVLLPLYWNSFLGLFIASALTIGSCLAVGIITYVNDYDPTILISTANLELVYKIVDDIHIKTFTYFGPYCIGIFVGHWLIKRPKLQLNYLTKLLGWTFATVTGLFSLYGTHAWNSGKFPSSVATAIYAGMHRTSFVVAVAWVALLCITENAEIISSILKFRPFILMSRLTFMTYLMQGPVIWTRYGSLKERMYYSHYNLLYEYMGNLILSLSLAFAGHIMVEAPFANLERLLFSNIKLGKSSSPDKPVGNADK